MSLVFKRLRRILEFYGNTSFQFIACSATLPNPDNHLNLFLGLTDVVSISRDSAPKSKKYQIVLRPNLKTNFLGDSCDVALMLMSNQLKTIVFTRSRQECELMMLELNRKSKLYPNIQDKFSAYRGGYSASDRRAIEEKLLNGKLLSVICTSALELGIDIGCLDAVVHVGFPVSMTSFVQQSGRAGRRQKAALDILVILLFYFNRY